jgi:hypothetical protein
MTIPLDASGLNFRAGLGPKKIFADFKISAHAPRPSSKVRERARRGPGPGRAQNTQVYRQGQGW